MADPGSTQQAMEHAVRHARGRLNDGDLVQGTLEHLWRLAFAAGVRAGQAAVPPSQRSQPWAEGLQARQEGWTWGGWVHLGPGSRFCYGGTDPAKPGCERLAVMGGFVQGRVRMLLTDTGENVKVPGMCWTRLVPEEEEDG